MSIKQSIVGIGLWLLLLICIIGLPFIPFSSQKPVKADFLQQANHSQAIVFFGFPQCHGVCPTAMATLKQWYNQQKSAPSVSVFFVNIDPKGTDSNTHAYASGFHPSFIGFQPTADELSQLVQQFGLNLQSNQGAIEHQGRTYWLEQQNNDWVLTSTLNPQGLSVSALNQIFKRQQT